MVCSVQCETSDITNCARIELFYFEIEFVADRLRYLRAAVVRFKICYSNRPDLNVECSLFVFKSPG